MTRIAIAGGTGMLGRAVSAVLEEKGHSLLLLSRRARIAPGYEQVVQWDPASRPAPAAALSGVQAVINLGGEPVSGRWTRAKRERIRSSRVQGTANLVRGMLEARPGPQLLISASAIGYYGPRGDQVLTERASSGDSFLAQVAREWEGAAEQFAAAGNRLVTMRLGIVLGRGGALKQMLPLARLGLGGPLGSGRQWWSWVHIADVCRFVARAIDDIECGGTYNLTAPEPVRQRDFAHVLGRVLGRPAVLPAPAFGLRLLLGGFAAELLDSKRVVPERLQNSEWRFAYPELESALKGMVRRGRSDGQAASV